MASIRQRGDAWWLDYRGPEGKRQRKSLHTTNKEDALEVLRDYEARERSEKLGIKQRDISYSQLRADYIEWCRKKLAPRTLIRTMVAINHMEEFRLPKMATDITPHVLVEWYNALREKEPNRRTGIVGRNRKIESIMAMMRWAENNLKYDLPLQRWGGVRAEQDDELPSDRDYYTDAHLAQLAPHTKGQWETARLLGTYLGLRPTEIFHTRFDRIDWDMRTLEIRDVPCECYNCETFRFGHWGTKTLSSRRTLPIPWHLYEHLKERAASAKGPWVISEEGKRPTEPSFMTYIARLHKNAGLKGTCYLYRHTFASHWVISGGDIHMLSKLMGHTSVTMTERYEHLQIAHQKQRCTALGIQLLSPDVAPAVLFKRHEGQLAGQRLLA